MKRALLICLVSLGLPASAQAATSAPSPFQGWIDRSRVATPDVTVAVEPTTPDACPGALACTDGATIWFDGSDRGEFFHELGHVLDRAYFGEAEHARFQAIIGRVAVPWYAPGDGGLAGASEWFADVYSLCARQARIDPRWSYTVASGLLRGRRLARGCRFVDRVAALR